MAKEGKGKGRRVLGGKSGICGGYGQGSHNTVCRTALATWGLLDGLYLQYVIPNLKLLKILCSILPFL